MLLVKPTKKFEQSWLLALEEFIKEGKKVFWELPQTPANLDEYLEQVDKNSHGIDLPPQVMPTSTYWLIDKDEYIGHAIIRHRLNDRLLRQGGHIGYAIRPSKRKMGYGKKILKLILQKAQEMGLRKVLVTCDDNNTPSAKIIESNGGRLENKIKVNNKLVRRYWIDLKSR